MRRKSKRNKGTKKATEEEGALEIQAVANTDPSSPYDFESVTLIIKSQKTDTKGKQRANVKRHGRHSSQKQIRSIAGTSHPGSPLAAEWHTDAHAQASSLLSWLVDLAALCDRDSEVLHMEVRA